MERIQTVDAFEILLTTFNKKDVVSNFYMLKEEYSKYIHAEDLFFYADGQNLYIYLKKQGFLKLYYFINDLNQPYLLGNPSQSQVLEIVYRGEKQYPTSHIDFWKSWGFDLHLSRDCYFLKNKELSIDVAHSAIRIACAKSENELLYAKRLMEENLDLYTGDQLTMEEIQYFANENWLYIAYEGEQPCGMLQAELKHGVFWLGHIVVDAKFRGKGIAKVLVEHYLSTGIKLNCNQFQLWVIQDNAPAVNLYKKYGFNYLNRSTCSMLKK